MAITVRAVFFRGLAVSGFLAAAALPGPAAAATSFQVSFNDPGAVYAAYYDRIRSNVIRAGNEWASYFGSSVNATVQVQLSFSDIVTASASSLASAYVGVQNGIATYEQGAAYEMRTGIDPNGTAPDIRFTIGRNGYLQNELWFDPSPTLQTAAVPTNRTDARSVFVHEFGHALGFSGWRNGFTGALPGAYQSTFDRWITTGTVGGRTQLFFSGSNARSLYGGPVPITLGNYGHLGNASPGIGASLVADVMNGVSFTRGTRYHVSPLDLAIFRDTGMPISSQAIAFAAAAHAPLAAAVPFASPVPEPSTYALMLGGLAALVWWRRRASRAA